MSVHYLRLVCRDKQHMLALFAFDDRQLTPILARVALVTSLAANNTKPLCGRCLSTELVFNETTTNHATMADAMPELKEIHAEQRRYREEKRRRMSAS